MVDRATDIRFGLHSSTTDFTSTPGTTSTIEVLSHGLRPSDRKRIERNLFSNDNREFPGIEGEKNLDAISIEMFCRGVDSNGDGGAFTPQTSMEQCRMFDSAFAGASAAISGTAVTTSGGSTPDLTVSGTTVATGDMVLFATDGDSVAREVSSGGGTTTLTLDRGYSGTPTGTVVRAARWNLDPDSYLPTHGYFAAENIPDDWRREHFGCACSQLVFDATDGDVLRISSTWMPSNISDVAEASPSYSAPTAGSYIPVSDGAFYIGSTEFLLRSLKVTLTNELIPRRTFAADEGILGYKIGRKTVTVEGMLYVGTNPSSIGEVQDSTGTPSVAALTGYSANKGTVIGTYDVAVQLGQAAGAACYMRFPALEFRGKVAAGPEGQTVLNFTGIATTPSSGSAFRLGIF